VHGRIRNDWERQDSSHSKADSMDIANGQLRTARGLRVEDAMTCASCGDTADVLYAPATGVTDWEKGICGVCVPETCLDPKVIAYDVGPTNQQKLRRDERMNEQTDEYQRAMRDNFNAS
jgi:hypothetical protein